MTKIIKAEVITIGDEILIGQITDTNTQWLSVELNKIGIKVIRKSSVGDEKSEIISILNEASSRADLVIITGGLGPTKDDITKHTLCEYFNSTLVVHEPTLKIVEDYFIKRNKTISDINKAQALVPACCEVLLNTNGTAPGMWFENNSTVFISLPGVPFEMKAIMLDNGFRKISSHFITPFILHKTILTVGIGESHLAEMMIDWENNLPPHFKLAYLPSPGLVRLRLTATDEDKERLTLEMEKQLTSLTPLIEKHIYALEDKSIEKVIAELLIEKNQTIAVAESCTGGALGAALVSLSGASRFFQGGIIAYQNQVKIVELNVSENILMTEGAVSENCVKEMALGVRNKFKTDIGIAISGIAGPSGGTLDKPVGTVCIACAWSDTDVITKQYTFGKLRDVNMRLSVVYALKMIRDVVLSK